MSSLIQRVFILCPLSEVPLYQNGPYHSAGLVVKGLHIIHTVLWLPHDVRLEKLCHMIGSCLSLTVFSFALVTSFTLGD